MLVNPSFWKDRRVLVTGHTGFKGSWLSLWLTEMGAKVTGLSLAPERPSMFEQVGLKNLVDHNIGDIRDPDLVDQVVRDAEPQAVFHLAAQPIVRRSYDEPRETFAVNVQGSVNVLDACRRADRLEAIVAVTSDKCYENREWAWSYRESDHLGGHDPYSASKGAAELVIASYRNSFFNTEGAPQLASVRAGNVIGGGDWAEDRLIPDIVRAIMANESVMVRSPNAVRPWQHVLEALSGYLLIAQHLTQGDEWAASAWNFGPLPQDAKPVGWVVDQMINRWGSGSFETKTSPQPHETNMLQLDCSKAHAKLGWRLAFDLFKTVEWIIDWYKKVHESADALTVSCKQIHEYRALLDETLSERTRI